MKATLETVGWEIMIHPPYSPGLSSSNFHLFGLMKVHLEGQKFQNEDEMKHGVLSWLCSQDKAFCAVGISNL
jgi:histone-lysine N-methyltransferase SETMAR